MPSIAVDTGCFDNFPSVITLDKNCAALRKGVQGALLHFRDIHFQVTPKIIGNDRRSWGKRALFIRCLADGINIQCRGQVLPILGQIKHQNSIKEDIFIVLKRGCPYS